MTNKPLNPAQLVEKWRSERAHTYASENADLYRGFDNGCHRCAEALELWLNSLTAEQRKVLGLEN